MKLPRVISGIDLAKSLSCLGYEISHQTGSHIRLTTQHTSKHHITIPFHNQLHVGTINAILRDLSKHHQMNRDELVNKLFL